MENQSEHFDHILLFYFCTKYDVLSFKSGNAKFRFTKSINNDDDIK